MMPISNVVLTRLRAQVDSDELAQTVGRLIRLPEIWSALSDSGTPDGESAVSHTSLAPDDIVFGAFPGQAGVPDPTNLTADQRTELERVIAGVDGATQHSGLESIAIHALALIEMAGQPEGPQTVVDRVQSQPDLWQAPLAVAWPHFDDADTVLSILLSDGDLDSVKLAVVCLLSQSGSDAAATSLLGAFPHAKHRLIQHLRDLGEDQVAETVARQILAADDPARSRKHDPVEALIDQAAAQERVNGSASAQHLLDAAWERAGDIRAEIADRLADLAEGAGESVVAAEALRQAVSEHATADRKARATLALIDSGQIDEGLAMLPASPETATDFIAVGLAYAKDERCDEAVHYLRSAADAVAGGEDLHPRWMARLTHALLETDQPGQAAQVAQAWSRVAPGSREARIALAKASHAAGDDEGAVSTADVLLAQDGTDDQVREILAHSLQAQGKPDLALEHWQQLALSNARVLKQVVECALEADQVDLARDQAARWLALDPDSPQALVYYGRTLTACGDVDTAKKHLAQATDRAPQSPDTWLALAEAQRATGEDDLADETLARAIQICPDQPSLLTAKGKALAEQEHYGDALEHFEKALRLSANDPDIQLGYGQLLLKLGHVDQAVPVLEGAQTRRTAHLPTRIALAEAYEQIGDVIAAHELVSRMPDGASDQAQVLAGRVAIKAAIQNGDTGIAEHGLHRLRLASADGSETENALWIAEGLRMVGKPEEAMATYQSCLNGDHALTGSNQTRAIHGLAKAAMDAGENPVAISVLEGMRQTSGGGSESLMLLSKAYRRAGLADEALAPAMEAVDRDPDSADARSEAVAAAMESEAWGAALAQINRWADASPADPEVWIQKGRLHIELGQDEEARSALARALQVAGDEASVIQPISQLLVRLGKPQQAVRLLKRVARAEPHNDTIAKSLAETAEHTKDFETAFEAWSSISERDPEDQTALRHVGECLWRLHRRSAAIGYWQRALAQEPKNVGLAVRLSRAHMENGEPERALEHLRQALELSPDDTQLAVEAAAAFRRHGTPAEALEILQTTSALVPADSATRLAIADTFSEMGSLEEARRVLAELAEKTTPAPAGALARLSLISSQLGEQSAAEDAFERIDFDGFEAAQDAVWAARAGFSHAAWQRVAAAIEWATENTGDDTGALVDAVELRARLMDAAWLYGEAGKTGAHAPQDADVSPDWAERIVAQARQMGVDETVCQLLDQQLALAAGRIESDSVDPSTATSPMLETLAIAHLRAGEPEKVIGILADSPSARENDWAPLLAGLAHLQAQRPVQAQKAFDAVPPLPAVKPLAAYFTGLAHLQQDEVAQAIEALNDALASWPDEATWHHTLGQAYAAIGEADMALPHFQQASEIEPGNGIYCLALANHLQAMGVHHQSEEHFVHALEHFPSDSDVWRQAGYSALAVGDSDQALSRFRRASELAPKDCAARIGAARAAQAAGQMATALQWAGQAVDLAPENADALMGLADILAAQGKSEKALAAYQQAEVGMADPTLAQKARSRLFLEMGRPEAAALELMKVIDTRPDDETAWSNLATAYERSGQIDEATEAVKKALAISPAGVPHRLSLARLSRKSGQLDHALSELSSLQVEQPNDPEVAYELARVYEARRDFDKALDGYRRTIALDQQHAGAHFRAGLMLKSMKDYNEAAAMLKCAVDLNPRDADAHHQLAAVRALELVHGGIQPTPAVAQ